MKRFLSIMLTVMLVLSSFVMVSADDSFSVINVIETASHSLDTTYTGFYEISADVFVTADVTSAAISVSLDNGDRVATAPISMDTKGEWQTAKVNVINGSFNKVNFLADGVIYVKSVKVLKLYNATLLYKEDFEDGEASGYEFKDVVNGETTDYSTFTVSENIGDNTTKVGNLYNSGYNDSAYSNGNASRVTDSGEPDNNTSNAYQRNMEFFQTNANIENASKVHLSFKYYVAGNAQRDGANDKLVFGLINDSGWNTKMPKVRLGATNAWCGQTSGESILIHNVAAKTWVPVSFTAEKYQNGSTWNVDYTIDVNGQTKTITYENAASSWKNILLAIDRNDGGRVYIDDIKIHAISEDFSKIHYSEDFDTNTTVDGDAPGFILYNEGGAGSAPTFTVQNGIGGNTTKVGRLDNKYVNNNDLKCYNDEGKEITKDVTQISTWEGDNFYVDFDAEGATKVKLEFDAYNAGNRYDNGWLDELTFAIHDGTANKLFPGEVPRYSIGDSKATNSYFSGLTGENYATVNAPVRTWQKVVYEIERYKNADNTWAVKYSLTYGGQKLEKELGNAWASKFSKLCIGIERKFGGRFYIDNIKVSSEVSTESEFAALTTISEEVYAVKADFEELTEDYKVTAGIFAENTQSISLLKAPGAANKIYVVTAIFSGNVLQDAASNEVDTTNNLLFGGVDVELENKVKVPSTINGETFKVFIFNSVDGLVPLATVFNK